MTKNMGSIDRGLRLLVAAVLLYVAFGTTILGAGPLMWVAVGVAAIFTLTSLVGSCPLYTLIGVKTCRARA